MTPRARKILEDAYALDPDERALVAAELAESVEDDPDEVRAAWAREAVARLERLERGETELVQIDEVRAFIRQLLDAR